ncbi:MAG: hypothetical protein AAFY54_01855 [Cyanobacteria bacterium J06648_10]
MIEIRDEKGDLREVRLTANDFVDAGLLSSGGIILPGHPLHDVTINQNLPPGWQEDAFNDCNAGQFIIKAGSALMTPASEQELTEYLHGGEYEEHLENIGESETLNS